MKSSNTVVLSLVACALSLVACSGGGGDAPSTPTSPLAVQPASVELDSYTHLNTSREDHGVQPMLDLRERVARVAREHSEHMRDAGFMGHTDPDGLTVADRLQRAGIRFSSAAENLAQVSNAGNPAGYAHQLLMDSTVHRRNILDERFEVVGVGVASRGDSYWVTQVFISR